MFLGGLTLTAIDRLVAGYREVAAFNDEPYADHWFEKDLDERRASARVQ